MQKLVFFLSIVLLLVQCQNSQTPATCHNPNQATAEFAALSKDKAFRDAHPIPTALDSVPSSGTMVNFAVPQGAPAQAYAVKSSNTSDDWLLLIHEWWGLNDNIKREAEMWAKVLNINVLALDLYDGKLATTPDDAGKLMQANDPIRSKAIIRGAIDHAGPKARFRTMGWCFGGGWALQSALMGGDKMVGCVMYYGMPEKDVEVLKTLKCKVVMMHASKDQWINDAVVAEFESNAKLAGKQLTVHRFDADHAFANPSGPRYNEAAANSARKIAQDYLMSTIIQ